MIEGAVVLGNIDFKVPEFKKIGMTKNSKTLVFPESCFSEVEYI